MFAIAKKTRCRRYLRTRYYSSRRGTCREIQVAVVGRAVDSSWLGIFHLNRGKPPIPMDYHFPGIKWLFFMAIWVFIWLIIFYCQTNPIRVIIRGIVPTKLTINKKCFKRWWKVCWYSFGGQKNRRSPKKLNDFIIGEARIQDERHGRCGCIHFQNRILVGKIGTWN